MTTESKTTCSAAEFLNAGQFDVVSLQHEFGIFGGEAGGHITGVALAADHADRHDASYGSGRADAGATRRPGSRSSMSRRRSSSWPRRAASCCVTVYRVPAEKIEVIPHGIPDFPFVEPDQAKAKLGFSGRAVILTFGLLSPNKGIEVMIDAMPSILKSRADAVYVVLGATHPNLVRQQGEAYRESLVARVRERSESRTMSSSSTSSSTRRRCSASSRCATSTSRHTSTRRR